MKFIFKKNLKSVFRERKIDSFMAAQKNPIF